jgi:hypothetical protein
LTVSFVQVVRLKTQNNNVELRHCGPYCYLKVLPVKFGVVKSNGSAASHIGAVSAVGLPIRACVRMERRQDQDILLPIRR